MKCGHLYVCQELLHLEERLGNVNRGASQDVIEQYTLPHKYKKVNTNNLTIQEMKIVVKIWDLFCLL